MAQGCTSWKDVAHEMVFSGIDKDRLSSINDGVGPTVCYARETKHALHNENHAFINALSGLPSCNLNTINMFSKDNLDDMHEKKGMFDKCNVYCAHEDCSAAASFMSEHAELLSSKCKETVYIHDGVKALSEQFELQGRCPVPNDDRCTALTGKNVVVTGGTRGLGFEQTKRMLQCGADHVTITGRTVADGKNAVKKLDKVFGPGRVTYVQADASTVDGNRKVFDPESRRRLNLPKIVNHASLNAGIYGKALYEERGVDVLDKESFDNVMKTNCTGVFLGMQAFAKGHERICTTDPKECDRNPSIVAIKSIYGSGASAVSNAGYQASKFCVDGLVKQASVEFARPQVNNVKHLPHPIRVNSVSPGFSHTSMTDAFHSGKNGEIISKSQAHGSWVNPKDVAQQVVNLFVASGVSGTDVFVDGGTHAQSIPLYDDAMEVSTSKGCCGARE